MKVFAIIFIVSCAVSCVIAGNANRWSAQNGPNTDYDQQWQEQSEQAWQQQTQHQSEPAWLQQTHHRSPDSMSIYSNDPLATELTDVQPYHQKITQRLENSLPLADQPKIKEKLMKFLEDKVHVCQTQSAGKNKVDRQCMGRLTGQMMQMIAAFENGSRDMPGYNW